MDEQLLELDEVTQIFEDDVGISWHLKAIAVQFKNIIAFKMKTSAAKNKVNW